MFSVWLQCPWCGFSSGSEIRAVGSNPPSLPPFSCTTLPLVLSHPWHAPFCNKTPNIEPNLTCLLVSAMKLKLLQCRLRMWQRAMWHFPFIDWECKQCSNVAHSVKLSGYHQLILASWLCLNYRVVNSVFYFLFFKRRRKTKYAILIMGHFLTQVISQCSNPMCVCMKGNVFINKKQVNKQDLSPGSGHNFHGVINRFFS